MEKHQLSFGTIQSTLCGRFTNKLLAKILYDENGKLLTIERFYETLTYEENTFQYQNCMITLTNKCIIKPVNTPYSIGYAVDGKITFNHLMQGISAGRIDYPDIRGFESNLRAIVYRNQKGELEEYFNTLIQKTGRKEIIQIVAKDFITTFEKNKLKHKDFKNIKSTLLAEK